MLLSEIWQIAGWTMLHYLWIGALLGVFAFVLRQFLRHAGANVRYFAAIVCFLALGIAPLPIAVVVARYQPPSVSPPMKTAVANSPSHASRYREGMQSELKPMPAHSNGAESPASEVFSPPSNDRAQAEKPDATAKAAGDSALSRVDWLLPIFDAIAACLPWFWVLGAPITFLLTTAGLLGAERLKRQSRVLEDSQISEICRHLATSLRISTRVSVGICERIAAPILVGILRPMILLPAAALSGWTPEQLEMVLLHELAHVRRYDNLVNLCQRFAESALFFHPMIWLVSNWIRREREYCCDELVVAVTRQPHEYAEILVLLADRAAEKAQRGRLIPSQTAISSMAEHPLLSRIRRIMKKEDHSMQVSRKAVALTFTVALAIVVSCGWYYAHASYAEEAKSQSVNTSDQPQNAEKKAAASQTYPAPINRDPVAITIKVIDENGKPIQGATAGLLDKHKSSVFPTFTTDANGCFQCPPCEQGEHTIMAIAPGHAPESLLIKVEPKSPAFELHLQPAKPIRIRVVDKDGRGMPEAKVHYSIEYAESLLLDTYLKTDSEGRVTFFYKPNVKHTVYASAKGFAQSKIELEQDDKEHVITLSEGLWTASGRVVDSETKAHITKYRILKGRPTSNLEIDFDWKNIKSIDDPQGIFNLEWEMYGASVNALRIEADGYLPSEDRRVKLSERQVTFDVELSKGKSITGVVRTADGKPLGDAEVVLCTKTRNLDIRDGRDFDRESSLVCRTNADGRFSFNPQREPFMLFVLHDRGYAEVEKESEMNEIVVHPWSRIEGIIKIDKQPAYEEHLSLSRDNPQMHYDKSSPFPAIVDQMHFQYHIQSDKDGRFAFDRVRPGKERVYRYVKHEEGYLGPAEKEEVEIAPGETKQVEFEISTIKASQNGEKKKAAAPKQISGEYIPQDIVEGIVVDEQGKPMADIEVKNADWKGMIAKAKSNAKGEFRLELSEPLVVQIKLFATNVEGTLQGIATVERSLTTPAPVRLVLKPSRTVEATVEDASGKPVADATVILLDWGMKKLITITDSYGKANIKYPADIQDAAIVAFKPGVGMDYAGDNNQRLPGNTSSLEPHIKLVLDGVRPLEFEVVDESGKPVLGVCVEPGRLRKNGKSNGVVCFWAATQEAGRTTDSQGIAKFDWLPADLENVDFSLTKGDYTYPNMPDFRISDGGNQHIVVKALTPAQIGGKVTYPDGKPAAGILVHAEGHGKSDMYYRSTIRTAKDGSYLFIVHPDNSYLIAIANPDWAAASLTGVIVKPGEQRKDLDMHLEKGCAIRGTVTVGENNHPFSEKENGQVPTLVQNGPSTPAEWKLPAGFRPTLVRWANVDEKGRYAFRVGPGEYYLRMPSIWNKMQKVIVTDQKEIVRDDHVKNVKKRILEGTVVDKSGKPVAKAMISGFGNGNDRVADENGRFKAELWTRDENEELCLYARSVPVNLAGYKVISPSEQEVTIEVDQAPSLVGRVLDDAGKPVADVPVYCDIFAPISQFHCYLHNKVKTDAEGNYTVPALFVGFRSAVGELSVSRFNKEKNAYEVFNGPAVAIDPGVNKAADIVLNKSSLAKPEEDCCGCRAWAEKPKAAEATGGSMPPMPEVDAENAAKLALNQYDTDHDGKIDGEEMQTSSAFRVASEAIDTDRDRAISAEEIETRINAWQASGAARIAIVCKVTYQGKPLADAEVRLIPEDCLRPQTPIALGRTDSRGLAKLGIPADGDAVKGVAPGFYRVEITKAGVELPERYHMKTLLGTEISLDAEILRGGVLRMDLF